MEIEITRTGGIAGLSETLGPIETEKLSKEVAGQVSDIVVEMNFFELPADIAQGHGADMFDYTTSVAEDGRSHTVHSDDFSPETYRKQLDRLIGLLGATFEPGTAIEPNRAGH